jgi:hypothetical protein
MPVYNKGGGKIYVLRHIPSKKAMKKMRKQIREFTAPRHRLFMAMTDMIQGLHRKLQGYKNYYLISPIAKRWLNRIDWYVLERLTLFWNKKGNKRRKHSKMSEVIRLTQGRLIKLAS